MKLGQGFRKLEREQDRRTDRQTHTNTQTDETERITTAAFTVIPQRKLNHVISL